ncbi:MAG: hypothetical protein M1370_06380 [Bacteroidetes bacterium]|nr:hypothetical protein [Bacteroidota bacterium]MCL5026544.1 hypothetical protein [Chloroflexota bacterium]
MSVDTTIANLIARHRAWWSRGKATRPLVQIQSGGYAFVLHGVKVSLGDGHLAPDKVRPVEFMDSFQWDNPIASDGDIFAVNKPTPLDWVESIIGCSAVIGGESVWTEQSNKSWDELRSLEVRPDNVWLLKLAEFTRLMAEASAGRVPLHHTLMRGPADMVSALTSHAAFCLSIYDSAAELRALLEKCVAVWPVIYRAQQDNIPSWHGGYCNSYGVWAPGTCLLTQEDASALVSREHYQEFLLPCDRRIFQHADYPMMHLHSGSLHTVDALLQEEKLAGIQVSLDRPAGPAIAALVPTFARILARKPLVVSGPCTFDEFQLLVDALPPSGLLLIPRIEDPAEARRARAWFRSRYGE